ncbi:MAG TPA: flagellar hook capping protein [Nitrospiraceae bacterium]|nr:MAG: hypothetical protein A3D21_01210 [Nitrospirae bacterium RIFCSPHIGHO2_02_FULL_42_12]HBI22967.1 flagellar hook capping protein [Nitrospiraceae bacterium]
MITTVSKLDSYPTDTETRKVKKELDKDDFLKLLVTQMRFQDPLKPMDQKEFTTQLVQFSSLDQLFSINDGLNTLTDSQGSANDFETVNFIGKEITTTGNKVVMGEGGPSTSIGYYLNTDASEVSVQIFDKEGRNINTIELGPQEDGDHILEWDGSDDKGETISPGEYTLVVTARDIKGVESNVMTKITGIVTGVSFEGSMPYLIVSGMHVPVTDISEVKDVTH